MSMLRKDKNIRKMWDPEGIRQRDMEPTGVFKFSGVEPEPQYEWDQAKGTYNYDVVSGWLYPVVQDWTDPDTGESFRQNQIEVVIDDPKELSLKFGDLVKFEGLGGFYSKKSRHFRAHAEKIEKVKDNGN